MSPLVLSVSV